jgi:tetratricopeptide (TPR) repeat protein
VVCCECGRALLERKDYDEAIDSFTRALALDAGLVAARCQRGLAYLGKQDYPRALEDLSQAAAVQPMPPAAAECLARASQTFLRLGSTHLEGKEYDAAIDKFGQALQLQPGLSEAYVQRGRAYAGKGMLNEAVAAWSRALHLDSRCLPALVERGRAYDLTEQHEQALADYSLALTVNTGSVAVLVWRGALCWRREQWDQAIADLAEARRLDPGVQVPVGQGQNCACTVCNKVPEGDDDRSVPEACCKRVAYTLSLPVSQALAQAYLKRARVYRRQARHDLALADCAQACSLDAQLAEAHAQWAELHVLKGDLRAAVEGCTQWLRLEGLDAPQRARALGLRGLCRHALHELGPAISDYTEALALQQGLVIAGTPVAARAPSLSGPAAAPGTDADLADVAIAGKLADAEVELGEAAQREGRRGDAVAAFTTALQIDPSRTGVYLSRGEAYRADGDWDHTIADYRAVRQLDPQRVVCQEPQARKVVVTKAQEVVQKVCKPVCETCYKDCVSNVTVVRKVPLTVVRKYLENGAWREEVNTVYQNVTVMEKVVKKVPYKVTRMVCADVKKSVPVTSVETVTEMKQVLIGERLAQALAARAEGAYRQAHYQEAVTDLSESVGLQPEFVQAHHDRALCYQALRQADLAEKEFAECKRLNPAYVRPGPGQSGVGQR